MPKFFQCSNKAQADALNAQIFEELKVVAQAQGYPVVNGEIVPKRNGIPDFSAQRTTTWDVPQVDPVDDKKYIVRHPEKLPGLQVVKSDRTTKYMVRHPEKLSGLQVLKPGRATKYLDDITSKISNREVTRTPKDFEDYAKAKLGILDGVTKIDR
jgi:hypothetical protein